MAHHAVSAKHLQTYLNEYAWRYSHRPNEEAMFLTMLAMAGFGRRSERRAVSAEQRMRLARKEVAERRAEAARQVHIEGYWPEWPKPGRY